MSCANCTDALLPVNPGSRAKVLAKVATISIALLIIAVIGRASCFPPAINTLFYSGAALGGIFVCLDLPQTLVRLILSYEQKDYNPPAMIRLAGRNNLISLLQEQLSIHDWDDAIYHLLKNATIDTDDGCGRVVVIGGELLGEKYPDALSLPGNICKPVTIKHAIARGDNVKDNPDFQKIVTLFKQRYEYDTKLPLFHLIDEAFDKTCPDVTQVKIDEPTSYDLISKQALLNLLEGAKRNDNLLTLKSGYCLDFSQINGLTGYQNPTEDLVTCEVLEVYDAFIEDKKIPQVAFTRVAQLITNRYFSGWYNARTNGALTKHITGEENLFYEKIEERFTSGHSDWAPAGSCVVASIIMLFDPDILNLARNDQILTLQNYRTQIADYLIIHHKEFIDYFETPAHYDTYKDSIAHLDIETDAIAIQILACILQRPIHLYQFSKTLTFINNELQPIERFGQDLTGVPISILGGKHTLPLFPK